MLKLSLLYNLNIRKKPTKTQNQQTQKTNKNKNKNAYKEHRIIVKYCPNCKSIPRGQEFKVKYYDLVLPVSSKWH